MFFIPLNCLFSILSVAICRNRFLSVPSHLTPEQASSPGPCTLQEWIHHSVPRSTRVCCHLALCSLSGFWKTEILLKCWFLTNWQMYTNASKSGIALPGPSPRHTCSVPSPVTALNKAWVTHPHCAQFHECKTFRRTLLLVCEFDDDYDDDDDDDDDDVVWLPVYTTSATRKFDKLQDWWWLLWSMSSTEPGISGDKNILCISSDLHLHQVPSSQLKQTEVSAFGRYFKQT